MKKIILNTLASIAFSVAAHAMGQPLNSYEVVYPNGGYVPVPDGVDPQPYTDDVIRNVKTEAVRGCISLFGGMDNCVIHSDSLIVKNVAVGSGYDLYASILITRKTPAK